jgi:proteasome accessory factor B
VWEHAGLAAESTTALVKLKAAGIDVDPDVLRMAEPKLSTDEPAFDTMWDAATRHIPVAFTYQRPGQEAGVRHVQPWGIISWHDRWYLGGYDLDREAPRIFRLSRVQGDVETTGEPGSYEVPEGTDMKNVAAALFPPKADNLAVLRVQSGRGQALRRIATASTPIDDEHDEIEVPYAWAWDLASEVASYGADVVVVSPAEVRDLVVARLREALGEAS